MLKNNQNELKRKSSKIEELERNLKFQTLYSEIIILINTASEDEKEELDKIFYGIRQSQDRNAYEDLNNLLIKFSIKTNNQNLFNKLLTVPEA
ncbi:TPA: hypothetical protein DEG21_02500 [Patescibacteria group bacterium]|nr:hypothetical protein [Candidatus Gracilibacteria bacterium]